MRWKTAEHGMHGTCCLKKREAKTHSRGVQFRTTVFGPHILELNPGLNCASSLSKRSGVSLFSVPLVFLITSASDVSTCRMAGIVAAISAKYFFSREGKPNCPKFSPREKENRHRSLYHNASSDTFI